MVEPQSDRSRLRRQHCCFSAGESQGASARRPALPRDWGKKPSPRPPPKRPPLFAVGDVMHPPPRAERDLADDKIRPAPELHGAEPQCETPARRTGTKNRIPPGKYESHSPISCGTPAPTRQPMS